ncbi:MAG: hypothetical protein QOE61_495 [Micromonosporaceae bacterium]|jgi:hypothetical protein|nr:hypothetical protein [Micromonosporaceae bacterium]
MSRPATVSGSGSVDIAMVKSTPATTVSANSHRQRGDTGRPVGKTCNASGRNMQIPHGQAK